MAIDENDFSALKSQVGGHPGVQNSSDGSLIAKPCLHPELEFYQEIASNPSLAHFKRFVPKFYGTLKLHGKIETPAGGEVDPGHLNIVPSIVLENISHTFLKPAILDVKLGTVLAEETASDEKKARMDRTARETTSHETGVRLTGFQVYNHDKQDYDVIDKKYGKSIKPDDLPDGMAKFLPVATIDDDGAVHGQGLPTPLLVRVIDGLISRMRKIERAFHGLEFRMVGGSALIVYESDVDALEKSFISYLSEEEEEGYVSDDESDEDETPEEGEEPVEKPSKQADPKPYVIKMIDFAHTHLTPGRGRDEGVMLGIKTTISLLEGRKAQLLDAEK
ncbi:SAICAR synthase-like protein [Exidia glandulosa HHB12029]|uniref:Kinase n=1 Tax=Exidia glandulosa HHB12029 TaxID=1314781 RepID=A0A166ARY5_EXIGL|nr:SAICAR synthase-like protein [Exidia glandulosa HHB12029]